MLKSALTSLCLFASACHHQVTAEKDERDISKGAVGVDLSVPTNVSTWSCVLNELTASTNSSHLPFAIVRVYRSVGEVDANAPDTLHSAHEAGFRKLAGYMFPCIPSSPYASSHDDVSCPSAKDQLVDTLNYLKSHNIKVAKARPLDLYSSDKGDETNPILWRIYLDIEDEEPSKYFDPDTSVNLNFIDDLVKAAADLDVPLGFYTTSTYWSNIMANTDVYSEPEFPLWYPRWDETNSMEFFTPFGGWDNVLIKQTAGDVALCGISQVDMDYMELF